MHVRWFVKTTDIKPLEDEEADNGENVTLNTGPTSPNKQSGTWKSTVFWFRKPGLDTLVKYSWCVFHLIGTTSLSRRCQIN